MSASTAAAATRIEQNAEILVSGHPSDAELVAILAALRIHRQTQSIDATITVSAEEADDLVDRAGSRPPRRWRPQRWSASMPLFQRPDSIRSGDAPFFLDRSENSRS